MGGFVASDLSIGGMVSLTKDFTVAGWLMQEHKKKELNAINNVRIFILIFYSDFIV